MHGPRALAAGLGVWLLTHAATGERSWITINASEPTRPGHPLQVDLIQDLAEADLAVHGVTNSFLPFAQNGAVSVLLATAPERVQILAATVHEWGGVVEFRRDAIGYLRVRVPAARWRELRAHADVAAAQLDGRRMLFGGLREAPEQVKNYLEDDVPVPALPEKPSSSAPTAPTSEAVRTASDIELSVPREEALRLLDIDRLEAAHPTFDGRGVTIAFIEGEAASARLDHPAFAQALSLEGSPIAKLADLIADPDTTWQQVTALHHVDGSELFVRIEGELFTLPRTGHFSWGRLVLAQRHYAVLWSRDTRETWVDLNQDRDFRNESPLPDVRVERRTVRFPDDPGWRGGHFGVLQDRNRDAVVILPVYTTHAPMGASVAVGSDVDGNLAVGIAPAARALFVDANGSSIHAILEALIRAMEHPQVDLVSFSTPLSETLPASDNQVSGIVADRLVRLYGKPIIRAAGNAFVLEAPRAAGSGSLTMSVGALLTPTVAQRYFGLLDPGGEHVWNYSSRGPRSDGRGVPDVVAPANLIAAAPCHSTTFRRWGSFQLPECYMLSAGTSAAGPVLAGFTARLISGAKQKGLLWTPERLMWAIRASARSIPGYRAVDQGSGVPQAAAAWTLLESGLSGLTLSTSVVLSHPLASYRQSGTTGTSLYERDGWRVGQRGERAITFVRRDGPTQADDYAVAWRGNDGTFSAPQRVSLPVGQKVEVPIRIRAKSAGVHSAIMTLRRPGSETILSEHPVTVAVADTFSRDNGFRLRYAQRLMSLVRKEHVIAVPAQLYGLHVKFHIKPESTEKSGYLWLMDPRGYVYDRALSRSPLASLKTGETSEFVIPDPRPGTWLLIVGARNGETAALGLSYELELSALQVESKTVFDNGARSELTIALTNEGAAIDSFRPNAALAQVTRSNGQFHLPRQPLVYPFAIQAGTSSFVARARTPDDKCGLHLYIYDCSAGTCLRLDAGIPAARSQTVRVAKPKPGPWKGVLTPGPSCSGDEVVQFETIAAHPALGSATPKTETAPRMLGAEQRWTASYDVRPSAAATNMEIVLMFALEEIRSGSSTRAVDAVRSTNEIIPSGFLVPVQHSAVQNTHEPF